MLLAVVDAENYNAKLFPAIKNKKIKEEPKQQQQKHINECPSLFCVALFVQMYMEKCVNAGENGMKGPIDFE